MLDNKDKVRMSAKAIALVGIMAATIECGKMVLSFLPNIEVVTLLCALFGYVFGWLGVAAAAVFVFIEPLIWGFGGWVITYLIYWPLVALLFMYIGRRRITNRLLLTAAALGMTLAFGVLSSLVDSVFYFGINGNFLANFALYYVRGTMFYAVQLACNAVLFSTVFSFLSTKLFSIKSSMQL